MKVVTAKTTKLCRLIRELKQWSRGRNHDVDTRYGHVLEVLHFDYETSSLREIMITAYAAEYFEDLDGLRAHGYEKRSHVVDTHHLSLTR